MQLLWHFARVLWLRFSVCFLRCLRVILSGRNSIEHTKVHRYHFCLKRSTTFHKIWAKNFFFFPLLVGTYFTQNYTQKKSYTCLTYALLLIWYRVIFLYYVSDIIISNQSRLQRSSVFSILRFTLSWQCGGSCALVRPINHLPFITQQESALWVLV